MKFKTIYTLTLLFFLLIFDQCGSKNPENTPATVEEAEKILAKKREDDIKHSQKARKKALKENFKNQSKQVRKSIKRNAKKQKKRMKNIDYRKVGS